MRFLLAALALAVSAFLFLQLSAEQRLADARDAVYDTVLSGGPRREDAIAQLRAVADLQPGTEALLLASQARTIDGELERGVRLARRAVDREPESFTAWVALAIALRDVDRREADSAMRRARELNPRSRTPPLD